MNMFNGSEQQLLLELAAQREARRRRLMQYLFILPSDRYDVYLNEMMKVSSIAVIVNGLPLDVIRQVGAYLVDIIPGAPPQTINAALSGEISPELPSALPNRVNGVLLEPRATPSPHLTVDRLVEQFNKPYHPAGVHLSSCGVAVPCFNFDLCYSPTKIVGRTVAIVTERFFGFGDALIVIRQIQCFVLKQAAMGIKTHVFSPPPIAAMFKALLDSCEIYSVHETQYFIGCVATSPQYEHVYRIPNVTDETGPIHFVEAAAMALGLGQPVPGPSYSLRPAAAMPSDLAGAIQKTQRAGSKVIGLQFHSRHHSHSWSIEAAQTFINLCHAQGMHIFILTPYEGSLDLAADVSFMTIIEVYALVSYLDAVVSIDSVCGHMAGVLGIPNLTLWANNRFNVCVRFRPLSMNYSIFSPDNEIDSIPPEVVFNRLGSILSGKKELQHHMILSKQTLENVDLEWLVKL